VTTEEPQQHDQPRETPPVGARRARPRSAAEPAGEATTSSPNAHAADDAHAADAQTDGQAARIAELERELATEREQGMDYMRRWQNAQADLAQRQSELRQRQLVAEVIKPAEAEAEKVEILAKADAERVRLQAEAAASNNRIALDRMLIDQLPQIVREAANGLSNANINVLNGADGLSEIAAGLSPISPRAGSRSTRKPASPLHLVRRRDST